MRFFGQSEGDEKNDDKDSKGTKSASSPSRDYASDWDQYSKSWDKTFGVRYRHLGDEWSDDGTAERQRDEFYFRLYAERFLSADSVVLEVGPGGGKWSSRIAKRVKRLVVLDVSQEMLQRTRARLEAEGVKNVEYVLGNGSDFQPVPDNFIDFFFSYDVFVHIAMEDTFHYTSEISRVLKPFASGACHYAIGTVPNSFFRIEQLNEWYRKQVHTVGQYYYFSPEMLGRMYEHFGLFVNEYHIDWCTCALLFQKITPVATLELLLNRLISSKADDDDYRNVLLAEISAVIEQLKTESNSILALLRTARDSGTRHQHVATMRRFIRGL